MVHVISNELLGKIAVSIMGGFSKDAVKTGFLYLKDTVKNQLRGYVLNEDEKQALTKILGNIPAEKATSEESLIQYLKEQLQLATTNYHTHIKQNHYGVGDNIGRDKVVRDRPRP